MPKIFAAGSLNIRHLHPLFLERLRNVVASNMEVLIGDADGADKAIQEFLQEMGAALVTVYCSGPQARNNIGGWPIRVVSSEAEPGTRAFFTAKDLEMAKVADYGLMVWDGKSTGTLSNAIELLKRGKKSVVFVNRDRTFVTVSDVDTLRELVGLMSEGARNKAESKIRLSSKIADIAHEQFGLPL
jgi:hypothetical protein